MQGPVIQANGRLTFEDDLRSGGLLCFISMKLCKLRKRWVLKVSLHFSQVNSLSVAWVILFYPKCSIYFLQLFLMWCLSESWLAKGLLQFGQSLVGLWPGLALQIRICAFSRAHCFPQYGQFSQFLNSCFLAKWWSNFSLNWNVWKHFEHIKGLVGSWVFFKCLLRQNWLLKVSLHFSQLNGLSVAWANFICMSKDAWVLEHLSQWIHLKVS